MVILKVMDGTSLMMAITKENGRVAPITALALSSILMVDPTLVGSLRVKLMDMGKKKMRTEQFEEEFGTKESSAAVNNIMLSSIDAITED